MRDRVRENAVRERRRRGKERQTENACGRGQREIARERAEVCCERER